MPNKKQIALLETQRATFEEQQQAILRRLQIKELPPHETRFIPLACIEIPDEASVHVSNALVQSIARFGLLQAPSVVRCALLDDVEEQPFYEVIAGRRRTKGARLAGLVEIKCEVYTSSTQQLSALLALIENAQRSSAWVKEVTDLRLLVGGRVGMTVPELVACGFSRAGLEQRLKMAQLPAPVLDQIVAGNVPLALARKLVRLTGDQLARVVKAAQDAPLTTELVKEALREQWRSNLSPMQAVFPSCGSFSETESPWTVKEEEEAEAFSQDRALTDLLAILRAFLQSDAYHQVADAHMLVQALIQRLEVAAREQKRPISHPLAS
ncbi:MAG TPA: ParB/RepB/Spo0J family partition protein [Ktedonobacteraceae bacterium]|nr:ParB/RepB/Spo0J family partition protein [Ktedonobacteraceae bacterium]